MSKQWGEGTMVVPAPREVDVIMKSVPAGKLITIQEIRTILAKRHGATISCPLTTGIFAWIAARAAQDDFDAKPRGCHTVLANAQVGRIPEREVSRWRRGPEAEARGRGPLGGGTGHAVHRRKLRKLNRDPQKSPQMIGAGSERRGSSTVVGLVLASTSLYRRALLERLGVPFHWGAPSCDESALEGEEANPVLLAERLAHAKAASLVADEPGAAIIGCDQIVSFQGRVFGKPSTFERAVDQLSCLAGERTNWSRRWWSSAARRVFRHTDVTLLQMRDLSRTAIERYVSADQPLDCAGSYKIDRGESCYLKGSNQKTIRRSRDYR